MGTPWQGLLGAVSRKELGCIVHVLGWKVFVCGSVSQSVSQSVQAFSLIASERLDRSGPGYHRWMRRSAGTTMAPVPGRPAARGTWHVPPREGLQKVVDAPTGQTGDTADSKLAGHTYITPTCVLLWLPFLWGAGCTRQGRKTFLTWDPPV